jgi:hypothetical protein
MGDGIPGYDEETRNLFAGGLEEVGPEEILGDVE